MEIKLKQENISGLAAAPDFETGGPVFAATEQTLLVSRDGGRTWQDALQDLRGEEDIVVAAVLAPNREAPGLTLAGLSGGVLRSEDAGQTWQLAMLPQPAPVVTCLTRTAQGRLLAGTAQDGVFVSADAGKSWARWNFGLIDPHVFCLAGLSDASGGQTIFAGTESGIFYSLNGGRSWRGSDFPMDAAPVLCLRALRESGLLFAGTESHGLFCSRDRGLSWEPVGSGLFSAEISDLAECAGAVVAASGDALWSSRDGGDTWQRWTPEQPMDGAFMCLAAAPEAGAGAHLLAGAAGSGVIYRIPVETFGG